MKALFPDVGFFHAVIYCTRFLPAQDKKLKELPEIKAMLQVFITAEVMPWRVFEGQFGPYLRATPALGEDETGIRQWTMLRKRVVEHVSASTCFQCLASLFVLDQVAVLLALPVTLDSQNIRVMAKYYNRISTTRLAELLELSEQVGFSLSTAPHPRDISFFVQIRCLPALHLLFHFSFRVVIVFPPLSVASIPPHPPVARMRRSTWRP